MSELTRAQWVDRLARASQPASADLAADPREVLEHFADESGHRRRVDTPFLSVCLGVRPAPPERAAARIDERLWWALALGEPAPAEVEREGEPAPVEPMGSAAIEVWTETELCAMHALSAMAQARREPRWWARARRAALWHLEHLQPDNATNHPWACHVFLEVGLREGRSDALLHADWMLQCCRVMRGRADRFSAHILASSSRLLSACAGDRAPWEG